MKAGIIEIDGKFYQKCKVISLDNKNAKEKTKSLYYGNISGQWKYEYMEWIDKSIRPKHLYIISDEEIKEGDWCIYILGTMPILQCRIRTEDTIWSNQQGSHSIKPCKKIIATTDESLKIQALKSTDRYVKQLPRLSNEFLQKYCEANGKIDEVLVEYENTHCIGNYEYLMEEENSTENNPISTYKCDTCSHLYTRYHPNRKPEKCNNSTTKLKIAPDNTITIKPVKERMYSRIEVELLITDFLVDNRKDHTINSKDVSKWIEENL